MLAGLSPRMPDISNHHSQCSGARVVLVSKLQQERCIPRQHFVTAQVVVIGGGVGEKAGALHFVGVETVRSQRFSVRRRPIDDLCGRDFSNACAEYEHS